MTGARATTTWLKDYRPSAFLIDTTDLHFDLFEDHARVRSTLGMRRNDAPDAASSTDLVLHGRELVLERLAVDGHELAPHDYLIDGETLTIPDLHRFVADRRGFTLECQTRIDPAANTALEGLYRSKKMFCTQCEAEGFRRITWYLDRPDVMSVFTTTITADRRRYPLLLSNGNQTAGGEVSDADDRHWASWRDPFPKPAYLFALVAADLVSLDDTFTTAGGRTVALRIFVEGKDLDKCAHAMASLKRAMRWDEQVYGREYDLDVFMIVAVDDFNMGAMENKGLNIFNTSCVLAHPDTTTDAAFQRVGRVVAHEYFHNWSGNRVTCRDWFQLSLKEGFTVFRESEFGADTGSRAVQRVEDVSFLRTVQFAEDAGPMAHPVQPDSFMEISNFYTATVYEKGAEVVRMISRLLGPENFRKGADLYFARHDGQAVTTDDFVRAMEEAGQLDLGQFRRWYTQAGTPVLELRADHDPAAGEYTLTVTQSCPATPGQDLKQPLHIPLHVALLDPDGKELELRLAGEAPSAVTPTERVLAVTRPRQRFVFTDVRQPPVPSLLRGFSAPVRLRFDYSRSELAFLMVHDSDGFNRWNASQELAIDVLRELQQRHDGVQGQPGQAEAQGRAGDDGAQGRAGQDGVQGRAGHAGAQGGAGQDGGQGRAGQAGVQGGAGQDGAIPAVLTDAFAGVLDTLLDPDPEAPAPDKAMLSQMLTLPSESLLIEQAEVARVETIHHSREALANGLARQLSGRFARIYQTHVDSGPFSLDAVAMARRALKNLALSYLVRTGSEDWLQAAGQQFSEATNMTDRLAALNCLVNSPTTTGRRLAVNALQSFHEQWRHEALVVDQWFAVQATCNLPGALARVSKLMEHPAFELRNPNKVYALIGAFSNRNHIGFHTADGSGYQFLADRVLQLDPLNPQMAARLLTPLTRWSRYDKPRQTLMLAQLQRIAARDHLSRDLFEVVHKSTAAKKHHSP